MKTFITPDDPYSRAASTCRTHNRMSKAYLLSALASTRGLVGGPVPATARVPAPLCGHGCAA
jgi:hypothetical protein